MATQSGKKVSTTGPDLERKGRSSTGKRGRPVRTGASKEGRSSGTNNLRCAETEIRGTRSFREWRFEAAKGATAEVAMAGPGRCVVDLVQGRKEHPATCTHHGRFAAGEGLAAGCSAGLDKL